MRCNPLILVKQECLQWLWECRLSTVRVSERCSGSAVVRSATRPVPKLLVVGGERGERWCARGRDDGRPV